LGRGKIHWTWRRPKQAMADWYNLLSEQLNKKRMSSVGQTLQMIAHQPGFHGVREQSKALFAFAKQKGYVGELPFLFYQQKSSQGDRVALMTLGA
jgi:hypothetical protein